MLITEQAIENVNGKFTLSIKEFGEGVNTIADHILDNMEYDENVYSIIDGFNVTTSDNEHMFTINSFRQDTPTIGLLNIVTDNGKQYNIKVNIE